MTFSTPHIISGPYNGNDAATVFTIDGKIFNAIHLVVWLTNASGVDQPALTPGSDYSVNLNTDQNKFPGGSITYPISGVPLPTGWKLTMCNKVPFQQKTDLKFGGTDDPEVVETMADYNAMLAARNNEELSRSIKYPASDGVMDFELPTASLRASKTLIFDAAGALVAGTPTQQTVLPVDPADTDAVRAKMLSNLDAKGWEDLRSVINGDNLDSAVNNFKATNSLTGIALLLEAIGADPNIGITISTKGTGPLILNGNLTLDGLNWPAADGLANQLMKTNGAAQIVFVTPETIATLYPPVFINGLQLSNGTDATNDIAIAAGACIDSADAVNMVLSSVLTKQIDANWAVGNDAGGFPSGLTLADDTWYHVFLIRRSDTGVVDAGFDTSTTAANLLADASDYDSYRRVGSVLYGTATLQAFQQNGDEFIWDVPVQDASGAAPNTRTLLTMSSPVDFKCMVHTNYSSSLVSNVTRHYLFYDPASPDSIPSSSLHTFRVADYSGINMVHSVRVSVMTNTSSQVAERADTTEQRRITCLGYTDFRGKN